MGLTPLKVLSTAMLSFKISDNTLPNETLHSDKLSKETLLDETIPSDTPSGDTPSPRDYLSCLPFEVQEQIIGHVDPVTLLFIAQYMPSLADAALSPWVLARQLSKNDLSIDGRTPTLTLLASMSWIERRNVVRHSLSWGTFYGQKAHDTDSSPGWHPTRVLSPKKQICAGITRTHFYVQDQVSRRDFFREPLTWQHENRLRSLLLFCGKYAIAIDHPRYTPTATGPWLVIECMKIGPLSPSPQNPLGHRGCEHRTLMYGHDLPEKRSASNPDPKYEVELESGTLQIFHPPSGHRFSRFRRDKYDSWLGKIEQWSLPGLFRDVTAGSSLVAGVAGWYRGKRWHVYVSECAAFRGVAGARLDLPQTTGELARLPWTPGLPQTRDRATFDKVHPIVFVPRFEDDPYPHQFRHRLYFSNTYSWYGLRYQTTWYMHVHDSSRGQWIQWPKGEYCIAMPYRDSNIFRVNECVSGSFEFTDGAGVWHRVEKDGDTVFRKEHRSVILC